MAIDPSISLAVRAPEPVDFFRSQQKAATLRDMTQQGQLQDLRLQEAKGQAQERERSMQGDSALAELMSQNARPNGGVDTYAVEAGLAKRGFGDMAIKYGSARRADAKSDMENMKTKLANAKAKAEMLGSAAGSVLAVPQEMRGQIYQQNRLQLIQDGLFSPDELPEQYDEPTVVSARQAAIEASKQVDQHQSDIEYQLKVDDFKERAKTNKPKTQAEWLRLGGQVIGAANPDDQEQVAEARKAFEYVGAPKEVLAMFSGLGPVEAQAAGLTPDQRQQSATAAASRQTQERGQDMGAATARAGQAATMRGQNMTDARARDLNSITRDQKPPSEGERASFGYYTRALDAHQALEGMQGEMSSKGLLGQFAYAALPNSMQGEGNQLFRQAQRQFTEARLRKDSGAAIAQSEYENDEKTYFPQPGDGKAVLERKQKARAMVLQSLKDSSGRAYRDTGAATPAAAAPATAPAASGFSAYAVAPDGKRVGWNGSAWVEVQ